MLPTDPGGPLFGGGQGRTDQEVAEAAFTHWTCAVLTLVAVAILAIISLL